MYAQVIVDIAHTSVDRIFDYRIPAGMDVSVGQRILVPFGKGKRVQEGYVVSLSQSTDYPAEKIREICKPADAFPALTAEQIVLASFVEKEYHCTMSEALRLMIPAQMRGGRVQEKNIRVAVLAWDEAACRTLLSATEKRAPAQYATLSLLLETKRMAVSDLYALCEKAKSGLPALVKKQAVRMETQRIRRLPLDLAGEDRDVSPVLTEEQRYAVDAIVSGMGSAYREFLLHGITGSGKTEVYLHAIQRCLEQGKGAIVLVPEISLTPQMVGRFRRRFGDMVAVIHSQLSAGERYDEWSRIRQGEARVVIGPRSAAFAPLGDIGLIVMDEEHEQSYRSENRPQYETKEIVRKRCRHFHATLVFGSATPSVETYFQCVEQKRMQLLTLSDRIGISGLPTVFSCDMREELVKGNRSIFSALLQNLIRDRLEKKEQIMLFINLRGYARFVMCRGCGYVVQCEDCDISYTYHKEKRREILRCHYCGKEARMPDLCPACGKPYLKHFGIGTQQVQELVKETFPGVKALRMDSDTTRRKNGHQRILSAFEAGEADILVGTQMIAKGLDFPNVTLVGVMAADSALYYPDYRSPERAFQLITQVAGRAGRDRTPGMVVVQTYHPQHFAVQWGIKQDYRAFYQEESLNRKIAQFPPYSQFFRAVFTGATQEAVSRAAVLAKKRTEEACNQAVISPLSIEAGLCAVARRSNLYRAQMLLKLPEGEREKAFIHQLYPVLEAIPYGKEAVQMMLEKNPTQLF